MTTEKKKICIAKQLQIIKQSIESGRELNKENEFLKERIKALTKKNEHYKTGLNFYRKETNKWKTKYTQLYEIATNLVVNMEMENNMQWQEKDIREKLSDIHKPLSKKTTLWLAKHWVPKKPPPPGSDYD
eukprot:533983_1